MEKRPARQRHLIAYIALMHATLRRKYTNEPYFNHLRNVAEAAEPFFPLAYEVGLCHDLLEDTEVTEVQLYDKLRQAGYSATEAVFVCGCVVDLTDVYTSKACPNANRKCRKYLEARRLQSIKAESQTVKYFDLIDNTASIVQFDPSFAKVYNKEAEVLLNVMLIGHPAVRSKAKFTIMRAKKQLQS